ncbi:MAG: aminomethyl transferase family protein [SAR202 cluster bacterium]|nr:aminomethyl transferase family protein [SAR202 cluster bacterium]
MVRSQQQTTSTAEEYEALTKGAALLDRSAVGRLRLDGKDALDLLNRLSTNQLLDLALGQGRPTVLTSNKGRIIDLLTVFRLEGYLLVLTSAEARQKVAEHINFYTFGEDVHVEDVTDSTSMLSVCGPLASESPPLASVELNLYESASADIQGVTTTVLRTDSLDLPGYDLIVPLEHEAQPWEYLEVAGVPHVSGRVVETVRIMRGIPVHGHELGEDFNPLEAGLKPFISFTKGCYVGQEVVARLNTYQKAQRRLVGLKWGTDAPVKAGAELKLDGQVVGVLTSFARLPTGLIINVGLGYVKKSVPRSGGVGISADGNVLQANLIEVVPDK